MTPLPLRDGSGNTLEAFEVVDEAELAHVDPAAPLTLALTAVEHAGSVLLLFSPWRRHFELPGGMLEPAESAREAAQRELLEETGIEARELSFVAAVRYRLHSPDRREHAAVFHVVVPSRPRLRENEEATAFLWWDASAAVTAEMDPLDAEIARRCLAAV